MAGGERSPPGLLTPRPADQPDRRFEAHQRFVLAAKVHWSTRLYPALKAAAQDRVAAVVRRGESHAPDASAIGTLLADGVRCRAVE